MKVERTVRRVLYPLTKPKHRRMLIAARDGAVSVIATARSKLRSQRPLPDFIIVGVQKGGTTFLYQEMLRHPEVKGSVTKEVHFFDAHFDRGVDWYSGMFRGSKPGSKVIRGEASPGYIFHPDGVRRIVDTLPDARLILLLRDPVQRALSHYQHERRLGFEPVETFEEAIALEEARTADDFQRLVDGSLSTSFAVAHFGYTRSGLYVDQLKRATKFIDRDKVLVLISEEMFADPPATISRALEFVGATPRRIDGVGDNDMAFASAPMTAETESMLREMFAAPNAELSEFLGRELPW